MLSPQPERQSDQMLLTVSIPTYNRAPYLGWALESILSQIDDAKASRMEIWISDNASTDDTSRVVEGMIHAHPRARIHYRRNPQNLGAERNVVAAAGLGSGEYVWIFGDDDLMHPGALNALWPHLERGEADFFLLNKSVGNRDLSETIYERQNLHSGVIRFEGLVDLTMVFGYITQLGFITTAVFRREPFLRVDPEPYIALRSFYPQNGIWLEAFHNRPAVYLPQVMVCHRQYNQNQDSMQQGQLDGLVLPLIEMLLLLQRKGVLGTEVMGHIVERPLLGSHQSLTAFFLSVLEQYVRDGRALSPDGWAKILTVMASVRHQPALDQALQLCHQYMLNLLSRGDADGTIAHARRLGGLAKDFFGIHEALGLALMKKGELAGAVVALDRSVVCNPGRVEGYLHLGLALLAAGQWLPARQVAEVGLRLAPSHAGLNEVLAKACCNLQDWNRAIPAARIVAAHRPGDQQVAVWLGFILLAANRIDELQALLSRVSTLAAPPVYGLEQLRGQLAWRRGEPEEAIRHLERERALFPENQVAAARLAELARTLQSGRTAHAFDA
ncbi:MAG: glycosyltransferase [Desulfarculus sp.]|nr:glycosyltransferase [Desulfarculus sp.]